jgi:hypothetical protein
MADALRERMQAAGLNLTGRERSRPLTDDDFRQVTLPMVNWWAVMVDEFAAQQGITPEKFMGDILTEGLYEVYLEFMAQRNDAVRAAADEVATCIQSPYPNHNQRNDHCPKSQR